MARVYIGTCTECKSDNPENYLQAQLDKGFGMPSCKFCGGVVNIIDAADRNYHVNNWDRERGIGSGAGDAG